MLLFNLATCVRVMQRKNSKQYITRQKNSLIESDLEIDNIHNQRIKIHNRKLYFYDNKPIGFAVAQSVEVQLTEEVREIGFFSNRRVVDAFHLKSDDKKDDKKKEVFKHDRPHRPGDPKVGDAIGNRYVDKPLARPNYGANGKELTNTARPGEFGSFDERQTSTRLDPLPPRTYPPMRDRSGDYIYPPSNRYNDNSPHNDPDLPTNRYKDGNDPYSDKKYIYPPINNSQNNDKPWYDDYTYDKPNITSLNKPPDYKYERQNSTSLSKQKEDREDKHHSIESDSSYDDDNGYGITKLDVFVEELKNGYFKLSNDKNCLTYFEEKYIFGICIKNDANQEFKVVNVDEALSKLKEEKEKKSDSKPAKLKEVTVTVTELPKMATTTVTQSKVMTEATNQNKATASKATPINLSKAIDKHVKPVKNNNVAQVDVEDDKGEDFFDKNSGDLLEALQKNFSFKDMPF